MSFTAETRRILELLRAHHAPEDGWATFIELRGGTGYANAQGIDFYAMHTWPSKNFRSIAYEVKVSRGDFKKELANPLKRVFAESVSNESLFVAPQGLLQVDEIPEGWGLMVADGGGLKTLKHGTQRAKVQWPQSFMAMIARRMADPPSALPPAAWRCEGREIREDELIAIAEQTLNTKLAKEREKLIGEGRERQRKEDEPRTKIHTEIVKEIAWAMGVPVFRVTPQYIHEWAVGLGGMSTADRNKLQHIHQQLGEILGAKP